MLAMKCWKAVLHYVENVERGGWLGEWFERLGVKFLAANWVNQQPVGDKKTQPRMGFKGGGECGLKSIVMSCSFIKICFTNDSSMR
jgi:hypothetical protein